MVQAHAITLKSPLFCVLPESLGPTWSSFPFSVEHDYHLLSIRIKVRNYKPLTIFKSNVKYG